MRSQPGPLNASSAWRTEQSATRRAVECSLEPPSPRRRCNRFTCSNPSRSPFRPQMEPKRSASHQHQSHAMEPKGKKSSPRGAGAAAADAESPLSSLFNPPAQGANGKDQDLYRILYKGQSGSGQAGMAGNGKTQWSSSKSRTAHNKEGKHPQAYDAVDTSCFASAVNYGGREYYDTSATKHTTTSSNEYKMDKKDPATDSHGDWWQGSFYY